MRDDRLKLESGTVPSGEQFPGNIQGAVALDNAVSRITETGKQTLYLDEVAVLQRDNQT